MYKIALLLVCAVFSTVAGVLTSEAREKMFKVQNECMKETGATDEMIMNAFAGKFTDAPELAEQLVCVGRRGGVIDAEGHIHKEVFKPNLMMMIDDEAKVDAVLDKCLVEIGTIQETAIASCKCMFKELYM